MLLQGQQGVDAREALAAVQAQLDAAVSAYSGGKHTLEEARSVLSQVPTKAPFTISNPTQALLHQLYS